MIRKILTSYTEQLEEFLRADFPQPEGIAEVGFVGNGTENRKNKLLVSLIGIERETAGGIASRQMSQAGGVYVQSAPPLLVNLNILLAAVYDEKRYPEALSVLSAALLFVQSRPSFHFQGTTYLVEVITPSFQEQNNIWTTLGGQYHPSVMCKLRRVIFDAGEIRRTHRETDKPVIEM